MTPFPPPVHPYMAEVIVHISGGILAILTGYAAVTVRKGEPLHRLFGTVFVAAMLVMATMATYLAISLRGALPGQTSNIAAGALTLYLVATAYMTVKRKEGTIGLFEKVVFVVPLALAAVFLTWGIEAQNSANGALDGFQPVFYFVPGAIAALLAALDVKVLIAGGISGVARISRHLWRMCFAFFFAAGSFFLGQQKVMPEWIQGSPVLLVLGLAPLAFMIFWLVRVRLSSRFKSAPTTS